MAVLLGRHQIFLELENLPNGEQLSALNCNKHLYEYFHSLARELDIMEPKTPEGIYKSHLEHSRKWKRRIKIKVVVKVHSEELLLLILLV